MILGFDRRYVLLPVALSVTLVVGAYVVAETEQARLWQSTQQAQAVQARLRSLGTVLRLVTDAETSERGFLLSGDAGYLATFRESDGQLRPALREVGIRYPVDARWFGRLERVALAKMAEMRRTIATRQADGQPAALESFRADIDRQTMDELRSIIRERQTEEGQMLRAISDRSRTDLRITRAITVGGTVLNVVLVLIAGLLVTRELARRMAEGRAIERQKEELEREVELRTAELSRLSSHLQVLTEREKSALARDLHDELGGLLVAAKMDLAALRRRAAPEDPETRQRWDRVIAALDAGVDLKRRLVEQLHPTLLDNLGLYPALRWQFQEACRQGNLRCIDDLPDAELHLSKDAGIAIFRIAQEALTNVLKHARARTVELHVAVKDRELVMTIRDDGCGVDPPTARPGGHGWVSMRHRVLAFGGSWAVRSPIGSGGTEIEVRLPLERILEHASGPLAETAAAGYAETPVTRIEAQ